MQSPEQRNEQFDKSVANRIAFLGALATGVLIAGPLEMGVDVAMVGSVASYLGLRSSIKRSMSRS